MKMTPIIREFIADQLFGQNDTTVLDIVKELKLSMTEINRLGFEFIGSPFTANTWDEAILQLIDAVEAE